MIKQLALLAVLAITMTGCIGGKDLSTTTTTIKPDGSIVTVTTNVNNSDTHSWTVASVQHSRAEQARLAAMTESVMKTDTCVDCTGEGRAWSEAFKVLVVGYGENFKFNKFMLEKPKSGYDVFDTSINVLGKVATVGIWGYSGVELGKAIMNGAGDESRFNTQGDITLTDSGNKTFTEAHATTGKGDPTTTMDNSSNPATVMAAPEVEEEIEDDSEATGHGQDEEEA